MPLVVRPADATLTPAVAAMNARLRAAGSDWAFYEQPVSAWLPADNSGLAERRHRLLVDPATGAVHGGYVLRTEPARLDGEPIGLGNVQGPVSEGLIDRRFALAGPLMLRDSLREAPLQIGWGTSARKVALLVRAGWAATHVPLQWRVPQAGRLAQALGSARAGTAGRLLGLAGRTGLASAAAGAVAWGARLAAGAGPGPVTARMEPVFGPWADRIWQAVAAAGQARLIADRSAATLARLMPAGAWPHARPIQVEAAGRPIGWLAVAERRLEDHRRLGHAHVLLVVDAQALPGREAEVAIAALDAAGVERFDLLLAAFTHRAWRRALGAAGFAPTRARRALLFSPALAARLGPPAAAAADIHLAFIDADGPRL